jgi:hypothetical protein
LDSEGALQLAKKTVVEMLRRAGLRDEAEEADQSLPDPVDLEVAAKWGERYGITRDMLMSRMGGSP